MPIRLKIHVEVFIGARILGGNRPTFSSGELIQFVQNEFGDMRPDVGTHVSAVCVANATLNHPTGYNYLWRIERDALRLFRPGYDTPHSGRENHMTQPQAADVPEHYRYLLHPE